MNGILLLGNGSMLSKHCTTVFPNELFKIGISNASAVVKETAPKIRNVKPDCNQ